MSRRMRIASIAAAACAALVAAKMPAQETGNFPHAAHAKVFPSCTGCHAGIVSGDAATNFPAPSACAGCHDGQQRYEGRVLKPVAYTERQLSRHEPQLLARGAREGDEHRGQHARVHFVSPANRGHRMDGGGRAGAGVVPRLSRAQCAGASRRRGEVRARATCRWRRRPRSRPPLSARSRSRRRTRAHGMAALACAGGQRRGRAAAPFATRRRAARAATSRPPPRDRSRCSAASRRWRVALAGKPANYPVPPSHAATDFKASHGKAAEGEPGDLRELSRAGELRDVPFEERGGRRDREVPGAASRRRAGSAAAQRERLRALRGGGVPRAVRSARGPRAPTVWSVRVHDPGFAKNHPRRGIERVAQLSGLSQEGVLRRLPRWRGQTQVPHGGLRTRARDQRVRP